MAASSTEHMEDKSERVMSPVEETGLQGKSELCVITAHYATLPDNIVTGVTTQLPQYHHYNNMIKGDYHVKCCV